MSTFSPVITVDSVPGVQVAAPQTDYSQLQASIGQDLYAFAGLYQQATVLSQIQQPLQLATYLANGRAITKDIFTPPDPKQVQPVIMNDFQKHGFIFDGRGALWYTIVPLEALRLVFHLGEVNPSNMLKEQSAFEKMENSLGNFFEGYSHNL